MRGQDLLWEYTIHGEVGDEEMHGCWTRRHSEHGEVWRKIGNTFDLGMYFNSSVQGSG